MKRYITYLYDYEKGVKSRNAGFIRVDVRDGRVRMCCCLRKLIKAKGTGKIYGLIPSGELQGIFLGDVKVKNGQGETMLEFREDDIAGSGWKLSEVAGVGIEFGCGVYLASCWKDWAGQQIARGDFYIWEKEEIEEESREEQKEEQKEEKKEGCRFRKITMEEFRQLPRGNHYLTNNRFLVHGVQNYGYLFLKTETDGKDRKRYLGVPGVMEKPERVVAALFGFPWFDELPEAMAEIGMGEEREVLIKNSPKPKEGTFGCWLVLLKEEGY